MLVDYKRKDYQEYITIWEKCRDVSSGQEAIHKKGKYYLPPLSGQTSQEYLAYLSRGLFYNATSRTIEAMSGLLFRKLPTHEMPEGMDNIKEDFDLFGNDIYCFCEEIADEVLTVGRVGILVDFPRFTPNNEESEITIMEAQENNLRPFASLYKAESIINWQTTSINNTKTLKAVYLRENIEREDNTYGILSYYQYRVLDLDEEGYYRQRIYSSKSDNILDTSLVQIGEDIYPLKNGQKMRHIPFFFANSKNTSPDISKPPFLDLVNVNLSHYRSTADLEHGAHYTGLPTAVISGHTLQEGETLKIGSNTAWVFPDSSAKATFLEFKGTGLMALENRIQKKEFQMAALGARMLSEDKVLVESYQTHSIKRQGENAALATISKAISNAITNVLKEMASWLGLTSDKPIELWINNDFSPNSMSPQHITALISAWQSGGIAFSDLVYQFQRGEVVDPSRTPELIKAEIENDPMTAFNTKLDDEEETKDGEKPE